MKEIIDKSLKDIEQEQKEQFKIIRFAFYGLVYSCCAFLLYIIIVLFFLAAIALTKLNF